MCIFLTTVIIKHEWHNKIHKEEVCYQKQIKAKQESNLRERMMSDRRRKQIVDTTNPLKL